MSLSLVIFATLFFFTVSTKQSQHSQQYAETTDTGMSLLSQAYIDFTLDFHKVIHDEENANFVYSPLGIQTLFSAFLHGASGVTYEQLLRGLRLDNSHSHALDEEMHEILTRYKRTGGLRSGNFSLQNDNLVIVSKDLTLKEEYQNFLERKFLATILSQDFSKSEDVTKLVNKWVQDHTHNMIRHLLQQPLNPSTSMALFNVIYFKGEWVNTFHHYLTSENSFWKNGVHEVKVKTMYKSSIEVNYTDNKHLNVKAIQLPYKGDVSMYIILPKSRTGLKQTKNKLTSSGLESILNNMQPTQVELSLPKFKIQNELNLVELLPSMGIKKIFTNLAQLSKISDHPVRISESKQTVIIEVDEKGTEAAAATFAAIPLSVPFVPPTKFLANHPFLFLLKDEVTGMILFAGEVKDPKAP